MSNSKGDIFDVFLSHAHVDADVVELIGRLAGHPIILLSSIKSAFLID